MEPNTLILDTQLPETFGGTDLRSALALRVAPNAPASPESSITEKPATVKGKARNWSITLNNPTEEELEVWRTATQHHWVKETRGQLEQGENGTRHVQGLMRTEPVAWTRVKRLLPRAHVEVARNVFALERYVQKRETRLETLGHQVAPERKVITPQLLHSRLSSTLYERMFCKGHPQFWAYRESVGWRRAYWDPVPDDWDQLEHWEQLRRVARHNHRYIEKHADEMITEAIDGLIEDGYYGAEYATSQHAARSALKRHFSAICIRHEKDRHEEAQRTQAPAHGETSGDTSPTDPTC